jgi:antitoxin YefM
MKTASVTEFRSRLKEHLQEIEDNHDILIISRPKKSGFVVLTLAEYESLKETSHLLSTAANAKRLMKGIKQAEAGKVVVKKLKLT